jgi:hypothetical protein
MATIFLSFVWTIPTAAKMLAILTLVYGILQIVKKSPLIGPYINGWVAIALNLVLNALGAIIVISPDQLYTTNSLLVILTAALGSAGIHGTVSKLTNLPKSAAAPESSAAK